jgi:hypothetical protein
MVCNVGKTDKKIRFAIGLVIFAIFVPLKSWWFVLGFIPIFTALIDLCPIYSILGINTCKEKKEFWS